MLDTLKIKTELLQMIDSDLLQSEISIERAAEIWKIGLSEYLIFKKPQSQEEILDRFFLRGNSIQREPEPGPHKW